MKRRTKDQIQEDKDFTCSKHGCKKICDEVYQFTSFHHRALSKKLNDMPFCESCFIEAEREIEPKLRIVND